MRKCYRKSGLASRKRLPTPFPRAEIKAAAAPRVGRAPLPGKRFASRQRFALAPWRVLVAGLPVQPLARWDPWVEPADPAAVPSPQAPNRLAVPTSGLPWRSRPEGQDRLADSGPQARSAGHGAYLRSRRNQPDENLDSLGYPAGTSGIIDDFSQRLSESRTIIKSRCPGFAQYTLADDV